MAGQILRYWDVVEPIFTRINTGDGPEAFLDSFSKVLRPIEIVYAAHFCLSEVHNGGLLQFFWNSTGMIAPEALEGFGAVGMPKLASVVSEAMSVLGPEYPRDREARWGAILGASPLSNAEIERIFKETENFYLAYTKVAAPLPFEDLSKKVWQLAAEENGDFGNAATQYLGSLGLLQRH